MIPTYLLISRWGSNNALKAQANAATKFLIFTFLSGALILSGILGLFTLANIGLNQGVTGSLTFDLLNLSSIISDLPETLQMAGGNTIATVSVLNVFFLLFLAAFAIKLPAMPLHNWLIDVHKHAALPVSMIVGGVLFLMGSYGLLRFGVSFFPESILSLKYPLIAFGAINILIAGIYALVQKDMRTLVAYSNISHLGFVIFGLGLFSALGFDGALFQTIGHALLAAGLFYLIMLIAARTGSFEIGEARGLAKQAPTLFFISLAFALFTLGIPLMMGFVAEIMVFYGAFIDMFHGFDWVQIWGAVAAIGIVLTATYMLRWVKDIFFGEPQEGQPGKGDIPALDAVVLGVLLFFGILWGSFPDSLENKFESIASKKVAEKAIIILKKQVKENE